MQNRRALRRLRTECEKVKRNLSKSAVERVELECLMDGIDFESTMTRAKFDNLNMDYFERCIKILEQCLKDAKMDRRSIDDVVLVGGSTRIVKVQEMLGEFFHGKALCKSLAADEAVAYGAAIHAAMLGGVKSHIFKDVVLRDVTPLSLGTENHVGAMRVFIARNTPVPASVTQIWTLTKDYLTSITYPIFEGEKERDNDLLGELHLSGITPAPAGEAKIKLTFSLDHDGILNVSAEDMASGNKAATTIRSEHGRPSHEDMERMMRDSQLFKLEKEKRKRKEEARSELERYVCAARNTLEHSFTGSKVPAKKKQLMEEALEGAMQWSEEGDSSLEEDDYGKKMKELQDLWKSLIALCEEQEGLWSYLKSRLMSLS